ncbi:MAG: tRNA 2-thiouridine(34) synthase MnmA [Bacteroidetes bacterium]|nr:tRNA 2-thiouridine(34) synthase MnmA [Bacteroidota bacterium]
MKRVVVGLSGGVDSSVAALLLIKKGYDVIGIFMKNWYDSSVLSTDECPWEEDSKDALLVAEKLGIPFQTFDFSKEYKQRIVDYMFEEYEKGRTPNPDVLCNREIKFDIFLKAAQKLGADFVATGHYCQKGEITIEGKQYFTLLAGADKTKDQSYFLCQISQEQLSKALFPIGHLQKKEVRKIALEAGLVTAEKKDSQGLCFIGKVRLPDFLQKQLKPQNGEIIEIDTNTSIIKKKEIYNNCSLDEVFDNTSGTIDMQTLINLEKCSSAVIYNFNDGKVTGMHNGAHFFTIGQRKGLRVGGKEKPLFVLQTDTKKNIIYTGQGQEHPGLYRNCIKIENKSLNFLIPQYIPETNKYLKVWSRIRYRQPLQQSVLINAGNCFYLWFFEEQRGITSGQFAAWYFDETLLGSGAIE